MATIEDYVARIEATCGENKSSIVTLKYDKKSEAIDKIMKKAKLKKSLSGIIFELEFQGISFRMFSSGKIIFTSVKNKEALHDLLTALLS
jgi:TATA-box binding protein (TBP) (component of TFIID and TFIIIB)